jgi:hypothetical protein
VKRVATLFPLALVIMLLIVGASSSGAFAKGTNSVSRPFSSSGSGTETSLSAAGCQFTIAGCTVQTNGTATSSHLGRGPYRTTLTVLWSEATPNGQGGFCAPAAGSSEFTAANGDQLDLQNTGTVCEIGPTGNNVPHSYKGTYTITGGTGGFTSASGSGTVTGGDDGQGNSNYAASGTISY